MEVTTRHKWTLTQGAFDKLLAALDDDRERAGRAYEELRGHLVRLFQWRGCPFPEDHADETLNRVARRIEAGEDIRALKAYTFGVARLLLLEIYKQQEREQQSLNAVPPSRSNENETDTLSERVTCLQQCLARLPADNRELIVHYYQGEGGAKINSRKKLAQSLSLSINTLRMRALRLREKLEACVKACVQRKES
jgi:RNA polymerase sigma factor (sigma-70 family)